MPRRSRIPPDVARVLEVYAELGDAARRALHVAERHARVEIEKAARIAAALAERLARKGR